MPERTSALLPIRSRYHKGPLHPRFKTGLTSTKKGYLQIRAGEHRGKYVHRVRMDELCRNSDACQLWRDGIPSPDAFTVHHVDHNKQNNAPANLMLLDKRIHDAISSAHARFRERFRNEVY